MKDYRPIEGKDYLHPPYPMSPYECLSCREVFSSKYYPKQSQKPGKKYGTDQLLSLWAWYNFKRHLLKCWNLK